MRRSTSLESDDSSVLRHAEPTIPPRKQGRWKHTVGSTALAVLLAACAQIKHTPVNDFAGAGGIPYYLGSWYLLTWPDGHGNLSAEYYYLRDPSKKMEAYPRAWLANLNTTLEFASGVLKSSDTAADSGAVPAALIEAAESFLKGMAAANEAVRGRPPGLEAPSIYKVKIVDPTTIQFVGDRTAYTVTVAGWEVAR